MKIKQEVLKEQESIKEFEKELEADGFAWQDLHKLIEKKVDLTLSKVSKVIEECKIHTFGDLVLIEKKELKQKLELK